MRIGVNLIPLWPGKIGGMETYVRNLLKHIAKIDNANKYFLFTASYNNNTLEFSNPNFEKVLVDSEISQFMPAQTNSFKKTLLQTHFINKVYKIWRSYMIEKSSLLFSKSNLDIWFCPLISLDPRYLKIPTIITIPDVQQEFYPQFFTGEELTNRQVNWKQSCYEATKILTISEFSKRTITEKYHIPLEKIEVTPLSVADEFLNAKQSRDKMVAKKYLLPYNYAYYPANTWSHKNHKLLIMSFSLFKKEHKSNLMLVLSGVDGAKSELEELIRHFNLNEDVKFLSYIESRDLPVVYSNAKFLIFPSLFEGFGIPLLEAMASDCPVAASNLTSIPEVAGKAALYFDPRNPVEIAKAFEKMESDSKLRQKLVEEGCKQLTYFSWDETAKQTIAVFEQLGQKKTGVA